MSIATTVILAVLVLFACAQFGAGVYEHLVLDPVWPQRPAVVQPQHGGVSRRRFWIPAHAAFEIALVAALVVGWGRTDVRIALLVALGSHAAMRIWSLADLIPKAVAFEKGDPATIERAAAERWTRRSVLRLPIDAVTCAATLTALAVG